MVSAPRPKNVDIVFFDAGSGHRSAAHSLATALRQDHPDWRVRAVDLVDGVAGHHTFERTARAGIAYFNWMLKRDRVFDLRGLIRLSLLCQDLVTPRGVRAAARFWADAPPDALVSVTPMYNELLYRAARHANPDVACVTIPVDFEEVMMRYWFTPRTPHHYLLASDRLYEQARAAGIGAERLHRLSGMVIDPLFYGPPPADVPAELAAAGLDPRLPTALVSFGGQGCTPVWDIAQQLSKTELRLNLIALCGRNRHLFDELNAWRAPYPTLVLAYAPQPPVLYHHLADVVVGKPGTMTITEAMVTRTPLVALKSRGMAPVQRGNERWLTERGVGLVAPTVGDVGAAVERIVARPNAYQEAATRSAGRGVFEAAAIVAALAGAPAASARESTAPAPSSALSTLSPS